MIRCLLLAALILAISIPLHAAETRGLSVVAKDPASGQPTGEVKLYDRTYAVIIGIDEYRSAGIPRLKRAVSDAKGIEQVLQTHFKFDKVVTLYNTEATRDKILDLLTDELPRELGNNDALFLFWAGHGNQEGAEGKEIGYLIPYDGSPNKIRDNITMNELRYTISTKLPAKHVFYVMDACYGGLLTETRSVERQSRRDLAYLKEITKNAVRQVLTAGAKGEEVLDGGLRGHSVFTGRLIEALESAGDFITATEITNILRERVFYDARGQGRVQTPTPGIISGNGDFVFIPSKEYQLAEKQAEVDRIGRDTEQIRRDNERRRKQIADDEAMLAAALKAGDESKRQDAELELKRKQGFQKLEEARQSEREEQLRRAEQEAAQLKQREAERQRIQEEVRRQQAKLQEAESRRSREQAEQEEGYQRQKVEEERLNAELRRQGEEKRKKALEAASAALSIEAAVEQIRKADEQITAINREFNDELERHKTSAERRLTEKKTRHKDEYDKRMIELKGQPSMTVAKPLITPRDEEFETTAIYNTRVKKVEDDYQSRLAKARSVDSSYRQAEKELYDKGIYQAESDYRAELTAVEQRISAGREEAIRPFRERIAAVAAKEYPVSQQSLKLNIGKYAPDKGIFPVSISSMSPSVKLSVEGRLPMALDAARLFKQQYTNGLVRPEVSMKTGNRQPVRVAIVNDGAKSDADGYVFELYSGEFMVASEKTRRVAVDTERERLMFTDPKTGLMWIRNGNIANKKMSWGGAMDWVESLDYGGYKDWRLPTDDEFVAFIEQGGARPFEWFNANRFFKVQPGYYWTSTVTKKGSEFSARGAFSAYVADMENGEVKNYDFLILGLGKQYAWPVRGGANR